MGTPKSWKAVLKRFQQAAPEIQRYFPSLPGLLPGFPWDVCLTYMYARVELAHNMALYCGAVRLHRADSEVTRRVIDRQHMTRDCFKQLFTTVFGKPIPKAVYEKLELAQRIRDRIVHGRSATPEQMRSAAVSLVAYAEQLNEFVHNVAGFRPFDDYRGFKGRGQSLDKSTTRWLLKGMGFSVG